MKTGAAILFIFFCCAAAFATTMQLLDLDQLTDAAQVIVIGRVHSSEARWEQHRTAVATLADIRVIKYLKSGSARPSMLTMRHPGGNPPEYKDQFWSMQVAGVPTLNKKQKGMFFLRKNKKYYELVGWSQGFFNVTTTSKGQEIVSRDMDDIEFINRGGGSIPASITLNHLVQEVNKRLK